MLYIYVEIFALIFIYNIHIMYIFVNSSYVFPPFLISFFLICFSLSLSFYSQGFWFLFYYLFAGILHLYRLVTNTPLPTPVPSPTGLHISAMLSHLYSTHIFWCGCVYAFVHMLYVLLS